MAVLFPMVTAALLLGLLMINETVNDFYQVQKDAEDEKY